MDTSGHTDVAFEYRVSDGVHVAYVLSRQDYQVDGTESGNKPEVTKNKSLVHVEARIQELVSRATSDGTLATVTVSTFARTLHYANGSRTEFVITPIVLSQLSDRL